jgi:prostaglandin-E synthase
MGKEVWTPYVSWAQRKDRLFVSVEVENPEDVKVNLDESNNKLSLNAKGGPSGESKRQYSLELPFYDGVKEADSKQSVEPRFVFLMVMKQESGSHWPRLTKEKDTLHKKYIRTDWTRYMDEDDEEELEQGSAGGADPGGFDLSQLGNMSDISEALGAAGAGGAGGADDDKGAEEEDSEDELPDLVRPFSLLLIFQCSNHS